MSNPVVLPPTWNRSTLGHAIELIRGVSYKKLEARNEPGPDRVPILRATNIGDRLNFDDLVYVPLRRVSPEQMLRPGDIVIAASSGSRDVVGKAAALSEAWAGSFGAFCMGARPRNGVEPKYVAYFMRTDGYRKTVSRLAAGTNINNLKRSHLEGIEFPVCPPDEQRRLVARLDELFSDLDAGVSALERANANLARYRAAVLKAAVEGKLTEQWRREHPDAEPASELLKRILAERRGQWEEHQLRRYQAKGRKPPGARTSRYKEPAVPARAGLNPPPGWTIASLGQIAFFQNGRAFPSEEYSNEGIKLLRPGNLYADGSIRWTPKNTRYLPERWRQQHPDYVVANNEIIINLTAQSLADEFLGRVCLTDNDELCLLNQRLARITPLPGVTRRYLLYVLKSALFRRFVNGLNTGSLIQHMFTSDLQTFAFPLAPQQEQDEIVTATERSMSVVDMVDSAIPTQERRTKALRRSVLALAFAGGLSLNDGAAS